MENYGYYKRDFNTFRDLVLVRNTESDRWVIDSNATYLECEEIYECQYNKNCKFCILYSGNEHLLGTTKAPEINRGKNSLNKIKLRPGYILEFSGKEYGVVFPTHSGLAVVYTKGNWQSLRSIDKDSVMKILGYSLGHSIEDGEVLWKR